MEAEDEPTIPYNQITILDEEWDEWDEIKADAASYGWEG